MSLSCDDCKLCCKLLSIKEVDSLQGSWCRYARGKGCGIYPERPHACRDFQCLWLMSQSRGPQAYVPEMRPDRSHVVFVIDAMAMPVWLVNAHQRALLAHCEVERPDAWRHGHPSIVIQNFLRRGGAVLILIGERRGLLRPGKPQLWGTEDEVMASFGGNETYLLGMPKPVLDASEWNG